MDGEDRSRIEKFRQVKKVIRGSGEHLVVGVDVGKEKHHAFFGAAAGKTLLRRLVVANDVEGFSKLLTYAEAMKTKTCLEEMVVGLEPTGNYHKPLGEYLVEREVTVVLVSNKAVTSNREMMDNRWDKHDTKDAANIADLVVQGKFMYYDHPVLPLRDLRNLLSLKRRLRKQEHGLRVRIRNHLLAQYFPELDRHYGQSRPLVLSIVRHCLNPAVIGSLDYDEFVRMVAPGPRVNAAQRNRLETIWKTAPHSIGCRAGHMLGFEAAIMGEGLKQVEEAIARLDGKIQEVCLHFPEYSCLLTIPGFGPDVSSRVLAAIGNPFRFDNETQVLKLAGWDLSARRSGKSADAVTPVISKKGKADLRYALYQAALIASTKNQTFINYYTDKLRGREKEKGIHTKMRVKVAAKLLVIAWTLMKKEEPFNPDFLVIG